METFAESEAFIKVTKFTVPSIVRVGEQARLVCNYELSEGETLHAMKLFKDDKEVRIDLHYNKPFDLLYKKILIK